MGNNAVKILAPAIAETGWQYGAQYLDKHYADTWIGIPDYKIAGSDLTAILYPVFFGLLAWQAAAYFWQDPKNNQETENQKGKEIGRNICLAMAGWTLGYYAADFLGCGKWLTATAVGVGIALPGLFMNSYQYYNDPKSNTKLNISITGAAIFSAGFLWYVDYLIPAFVGSNNATTHELMKSVVSPVATLITTAFCVWVAHAAQERLVSPDQSSSTRNFDGTGGGLPPSDKGRKTQVFGKYG